MAETEIRTRTRTKTEKPKSELAELLADIEKKKGPGVVRPAWTLPLFNCLPTGVFMLDFALMGGIPEGLATMIYGWESSGKSTLTMRQVAAAQRKYPWRTPFFCDCEGTFDKEWAAKQGVDLNNLNLAQPESGEEAIDLLAGFSEVWETSLMVLDSVPAAVPRKIDENSAEDATMGLLARLMGILSSKLTVAASRERKRDHWVTNIFVNQWRSRIGGLILGDPRTLPGGNQLNKYFVTTKIEIKNKEIMGKDKNDIEVVDHNEHSFKIGKAKVGSSIRQGEFQIVVNPDHELPFGTLMDALPVVTYAVKMGIIDGGVGKKGYVLPDGNKLPNLAELELYLYENEAELLRLQQMIISQQRVEKGLPPLPPDGFLLDWNSRENLGLE